MTNKIVTIFALNCLNNIFKVQQIKIHHTQLQLFYKVYVEEYMKIVTLSEMIDFYRVLYNASNIQVQFYNSWIINKSQRQIQDQSKRMIKENVKETVSHILSMIPSIPEEQIQTFTNTQTTLWRMVKHYIERDILYAFDQQYQTKTQKLLKQLDETLLTDQTTAIITKRKHKYVSFSETLNAIQQNFINNLEEQEQQDKPNLHQMILEPIFQEILKFWNFTILDDYIQKRLSELVHIKKHNMTPKQRQEWTAIENFRQFLTEYNIDLEFLDKQISRRLEKQMQKKHNWPMSSSRINRKKTHESLVSQESSTETQIQSTVEMLNGLENMLSRISIEDQTVTFQEQEKKFTKKPNGFEVTVENAVVEKIEQKSRESPKKQQRKQEKQIDFAPLRTNQVRNPQIQHEDIRESHNSTNYSFDLSIASSININQNFLGRKPKYDQKSQDIIEQYQKEIRFASGKWAQTRRIQVNEILRTQLNPVLQALKNLRFSDLNQRSLYNEKVQAVQVYGSWEHKCGFRKLSDININITANELEERYMKDYLYNLKGYLDGHLQSGLLNKSYRSVFVCVQKNTVILSHKINGEKPRVPNQNVASYVFFTINRKQHVESSRFINEVIYKNPMKQESFVHLFNILHLIFKRNEILQNKGFYQTWIASRFEDKQNKAQSQRRYVLISVYAMHMMILFYLQKTDQISLIRYSEENGKYNFDVSKEIKSLYDNLVGFFTFYSSQGEFRTKYEDKDFIEVVERGENDKSQIIYKMKDSFSRIQTQSAGYLFGFVHPMINKLMDGDKEGQNSKKYITFEIELNSQKERLFLKKMDWLLRMTKTIPNASQLKDVNSRFSSLKWDPNSLFEFNHYEQYA